MRFSKVMIPTLATLALGMSLMGTPASAATTAETKLNQSITGGEHNIAVTPVSNFNAVTLSGETQVTNANPGVLTVTDATGSGDGWRINVKADQFKVSGDAKSNRTLPKGSLVLNSGGAITKVGGTSSPNPEFKTTNFIIDTDNQVTILSAKKDEGMGKYNVSFNDKSLALTLNPHSTYVENKASATSYESKLTYSIVTGP
ncbi:TPA: WxL domain-containing protein [Bacillus thuringiensis]|nr:WxL domain-containing protein [Bacillus thuringiensis]